MSSRRRLSSPPPERDFDDLSPSPSPSPPPERRPSRSGSREVRISSNSNSQQHRDDPHHRHHHHLSSNPAATSTRRHVTINTKSGGGSSSGSNRSTQRQVTVTSGSSAGFGRDSHCPWYERMMPECLLTITAPITGYECQLEHRPDMEDHEHEILERERIRRNQRIRRRVGAIVLLASLASAYFFWRGRLPGRRAGVRGAISSMADGLKSLPDTMGK